MEIDELVYRMGGIASWKQLVANFPVSVVRSAISNGRLVKVSHGTYGLPGVEEAVLAARSLKGVLSLTSAALHHGWAVKTPPAKPHVTVPRHRTVAPARRKGVHLHFGDVETDGIATTPAQTVVDCARFLPVDEALSVADSALRAGAERATLLAAAERAPRSGRSVAIEVVGAADGRAANPFESVIRSISREFRQLTLVPQVNVPGVGRPDLVDVILKLIVECDSFQFHSSRSDLVSDIERYNACAVNGLGLLRFAWEHAMLRQDYVRSTFSAWLEAKAASDGLAVRARCPHCAA